MRLALCALTTLMSLSGAAFAQSVEEIALETRIKSFLGADWTVNSQFRTDSGTSLVYSAVQMIHDDITVSVTALAASYEGDRILGDQVSVHVGSTDGQPLFVMETLQLNGIGLGTANLTDQDCSDMRVGGSRVLLSFDMQQALAQPDPSMRMAGSVVLGDLRAGALRGELQLSRQTAGCVVLIEARTEDVVVISGNDFMEVGIIDVRSTLPIGDNNDRGSFAGTILDVFMGNAFQNYAFDDLVIDAGLPQEIIVTYLPFLYDNTERDLRMGQIALEKGADITASLKGLDLNLGDFLPRNMASTHFRGDIDLMGRIRPDSLSGSLDIEMPGAVEAKGDIQMTFTDNLMALQPLQIPFLVDFESFGFEFLSTTLLQDIYNTTGFRASDIIPEQLTRNLSSMPMVGESYGTEIAAIKTWFKQAEAGKRVTVQARPPAPVNMGLVGSLVVVNVSQALSMISFEATP